MNTQSVKEEMVRNNNLVCVTDCETGDRRKFLVKGFNNPFYGHEIGNRVRVGMNNYLIDGIIAH